MKVWNLVFKGEILIADNTKDILYNLKEIMGKAEVGEVIKIQKMNYTAEEWKALEEHEGWQKEE